MTDLGMGEDTNKKSGKKKKKKNASRTFSFSALVSPYKSMLEHSIKVEGLELRKIRRLNFVLQRRCQFTDN